MKIKLKKEFLRPKTIFLVAYPGSGSSSSTVSRLKWNLEMLLFVKGAKPENLGKNPRSRNELMQHMASTLAFELRPH